MVGPWLSQVAALMFFLAVRRHVSLTVGFWNCQYDIWVGLAASFVIGAAKSWLDRRPPCERAPALATLCAMPFVSMGWVLFNHLGVDTALIVLGLHSMIFTFLGREDRQSPYNIGASLGFLAFVGMVFWGKLHLTMLHAYVIPTGICVMALLHLFRDSVNQEVRNSARLVTVIVSLGFTAYYVFADHPHVWLHLALLGVLCVLSMGLGSVMRVKAYLFAGFGGLIVTLAIAMTQAFLMYATERNIKMTIIGTSIFVAGAVLVTGAVFIRTHKETLAEFADKCPLRPRRLGIDRRPIKTRALFNNILHYTFHIQNS